MTARNVPAQVDPLEDLAADVAVVVRKLQRQIPLVDELRDSRQPGRPFIPPSVKQVMGDQYVKDRRARREAEVAGFPPGSGASPAPGNMPGWALVAEFTLTLRNQLTRLLAHHARQGVSRRGLETVLGPIPGSEATARDLAGYLYELLWTIDRASLVRDVAREITHLRQLATRLLDGEDRQQLREQSTCPYCRAGALVAYIESGVIECDRVHDPAGHLVPCLCPLDAPHQVGCRCREDPAFTHTWLVDRPLSSRNSWKYLQTHWLNETNNPRGTAHA